VKLARALIALTGIILFLTGSSSLSIVSYAAKRGDFPRCQEECFCRHRQHMEKLFEHGKHTQNGIQFQEQVDQEVAEYSACLNDCRELMPVK
jgi:hypothetical protein